MSRSGILGLAGFTVLILFVTPGSQAQQDLIPDLVINAARLLDNEYVNDVVPGRVHIRLTNAVPNIGLGPLMIYPAAGSTETFRQAVFQRVLVDGNGDGDGTDNTDSFFDRAAGNFVFHPSHNHFHVDNWAQYYIREVLPGDGVGKIIYSGNKTSFCLLDSATYTTQPSQGNTGPRRFFQCGTTLQGISVGWEDIYPKELPDQWIDITSILPGEYWLESVVDPGNLILELDETNNVARVKLTIAPGDLPIPIPVPLWPRLFWVEMCMVLGVGTLGLRRVANARG
jgi:Lysyl oxidase